MISQAWNNIPQSMQSSASLDATLDYKHLSKLAQAPINGNRDGEYNPIPGVKYFPSIRDALKYAQWNLAMLSMARISEPCGAKPIQKNSSKTE